MAVSTAIRQIVLPHVMVCLLSSDESSVACSTQVYIFVILVCDVYWAPFKYKDAILLYLIGMGSYMLKERRPVGRLS